jgi:DEAD/DEAH box helicase domain-containing protein
VTSDNFVIIDETYAPRVIGEVDFSSALTTVHPKAIYMHAGQQYHVERMDFDQRKAYVRSVDVDHFTQAIRYTQVQILEVEQEEPVAGPALRSHGDVLVRSQVVGFKKIKFFTLENVGSGKLELPENEMHTTAYWITLERDLLDSLHYSVSERQDGMYGLLNALESIAALLVMCDRMDLGATIGEGLPETDPDYEEAAFPPPEPPTARPFFRPTLFLYDAYPGGIGLSAPLFGKHDLLVSRTRELIAACPCERGCPSCVGPAGETGARAKEVALGILDRLVSK